MKWYHTNMERMLVGFVLSARHAAREGVPRDSATVREYAFVPMGVPGVLAANGIDLEKIVDEVWEICGVPGGTGE